MIACNIQNSCFIIHLFKIECSSEEIQKNKKYYFCIVLLSKSGLLYALREEGDNDLTLQSVNLHGLSVKMSLNFKHRVIAQLG